MIFFRQIAEKADYNDLTKYLGFFVHFVYLTTTLIVLIHNSFLTLGIIGNAWASKPNLQVVMIGFVLNAKSLKTNSTNPSKQSNAIDVIWFLVNLVLGRYIGSQSRIKPTPKVIVRFVASKPAMNRVWPSIVTTFIKMLAS